MTSQQKAISTRDLTLNRSGIVVTIPDDWTVTDSLAAQRAGRGDPTRINLALIQRVVRFNGEQWTITDIEQRVSGKDFIQLQGELFADDDGDDAGND